MKVIFLLSLVVYVTGTMALSSKASTAYNDNYPAFKDELCSYYDYRTDDYNLFGQLIYLLLTLPKEENNLQTNCNKYISVSRRALAVLLRLKSIDGPNNEKFESYPKRTLDSIGGGHLIKRSDKIDF